jgi:hypothetical protein
VSLSVGIFICCLALAMTFFFSLYWDELTKPLDRPLQRGFYFASGGTGETVNPEKNGDKQNQAAPLVGALLPRSDARAARNSLLTLNPQLIIRRV